MNKRKKNKPIRKYTVILRCVPGKVKAAETCPGQPFQSLWGNMQKGAHRSLDLGASTCSVPSAWRSPRRVAPFPSCLFEPLKWSYEDFYSWVCLDRACSRQGQASLLTQNSLISSPLRPSCYLSSCSRTSTSCWDSAQVQPALSGQYETPTLQVPPRLPCPGVWHQGLLCIRSGWRNEIFFFR